MRLMRIVPFIMVLVVGAITFAHAQSIIQEPVSTPNEADIKHGAVLCMWSVYITVHEVGSACHASEDSDFQAEVLRSIAAIDAFIMENGKVGPEYIATWKQRAHEEAVKGNLCASRDAEKMYQLFKKKGIDGLHEQTRDLLSVPRPPVMNPCF